MFEKELNLIQSEILKDFAKKCIESIPDEFYKVPASSTGKYHPKYGLGYGGLYRHTVAAVLIAADLLQLEFMQKYKEDNYTNDVVIIAIMLHDTCKLGEDFTERYTRFDHPLLASEKYRRLRDEFITERPDIDKEMFFEITNRILFAISSHMGQWNTNSYNPGVVTPKPEGFEEEFVHLCDYLASRKYLEVPLAVFEN